MSVLGWGIAPRLADQLHTRDPFIDSLLICFDVGLVLDARAHVHSCFPRERGSLAVVASDIRDGLRAEAPHDPRPAGVGGKVWLWVLPFVALSSLFNASADRPGAARCPGTAPRRLETQRVADYLHHNWWGLFALGVAANARLPPVHGGARLPGSSCAAACAPPSAAPTSWSTA